MIYNTFGQLVMTQPIAAQNSELHIATDTWQNGIYFIHTLSKNTNIEIQKIIIQH